MKATKNWKLVGALAAVGMAASLAISTSAVAAGTVSLTVTATIQGICKVTAGSPGTIALGSIDPSGTVDVTGSANYTMKCTNGVASLAWDVGGTGIGASMARTMSDGTNSLGYTLSASGDTGFTGTGFGTGSTAQTVTLTATVTPTQFGNAVASTGYTETVTINVNP